MLENVRDLTLEDLNEATQAHRRIVAPGDSPGITATRRHTRPWIERPSRSMNYRLAFWAAIAACAVLLAVVVLDIGRNFPPAAPHAAPASAASSSAASSTSMSGMSATPEPATTPLAPVQLSPQRLLSIGVRIGEVERRSVDDQILTTGNVGVDETKLAYVQLRFSGFGQEV
jgi:hypothetical protein